MSSVFDALAAYWNKEIAPITGDASLNFLFEEVLDALHYANHRAGDVINRDNEVRSAVWNLTHHSIRREEHK